MNAKVIKAKIHKNADRIENGVEAAATNLADDAEAMGEQYDEVRDELHNIGRLLLNSAQALADAALEQARSRPLAVFAVAFVAGVIVTRTWHR
jgi:F0F1-type ATP synthase membrane subunit b/b'